MLFCYVFLYEQRTEAVNDKGGEPCDHALCNDNENRPFAAQFAFDGSGLPRHCKIPGGRAV